MVVTCEIEYINNPSGIYYAGQTVFGRITLKADSPKDVKGISFNIRGRAHVSWSENSNGNTSSTTYSASEEYIAASTYLMGSAINDKTITIEPGILTYDFTCHIPTYCPSSFESFDGKIRYRVKVALKRPWKFDQTFRRYFTVIKLMDLNYDGSFLRLPTQLITQKNYHSWFFASDSMKVTVSLAQTGFVPGQMIPINVLIANDSDVTVEELKVKLAMLVTYIAKSPCHRIRNNRFVLSKIKRDSVQRQCTKQFQYTMPVPATPPTCHNLCSIIKINYQIEIETGVKGLHRNHKVAIPITIGSVPLSSDWQPQFSGASNYATMKPAEVAQAGAEQAGAMASMEKGSEFYVGKCGEELQLEKLTNPWSEDIPPPTYEEAVHKSSEQAEKRKDTDLTEPFAPLYPVFNIPSPTLEIKDFDFKEDDKPK